MSFVNNLLDVSKEVDLHSWLEFMYPRGGGCAGHSIDGTLYEILRELGSDADVIRAVTDDFIEIVNENFDDIVAVQGIQGGRFIKVTPLFFSAYEALYAKQYQSRLEGVNFVTGDILSVLVDSGFKVNKELKRSIEILEKLLVHKNKNSFIVFNIYKNMSGIEYIKTNKQEI